MASFGTTSPTSARSMRQGRSLSVTSCMLMMMILAMLIFISGQLEMYRRIHLELEEEDTRNSDPNKDNDRASPRAMLLQIRNKLATLEKRLDPLVEQAKQEFQNKLNQQSLLMQQEQTIAAQQEQLRRQQEKMVEDATVLAKPKSKFLIFHKIADGQGTGNQMHGLLAAHLFADEFDRIVCVSDHYTEFHDVWEIADPYAKLYCPTVLQNHNKEPPNTPRKQTLSVLNYDTAPNECALKDALASSHAVVHITCNTYPAWPKIPKHINFFKFYKPKEALLNILPYPRNEPPPIVVHLRKEDVDGGDQRKGIDEHSLRYLGKLLPVDTSQRSPFLVTNYVPWFDTMEGEYQWSHPEWLIVTHSAFGQNWKGRAPEEIRMTDTRKALQAKYKKIRRDIGDEAWNNLQMWADWYTMLRAERVYHTFSDFSLSAVHWMGTWSRTYDGIDPNTGEALLLEENWIRDGQWPRLVDRDPPNHAFGLRKCAS